MRVLTLLVAVPMGVALASSNCNTKVFKALKSVENNTRVCEYLHDHKEKWSETNDKSYVPSGLKKFQVQDVYVACDCLNVEEEETPIEAPIEAPKGNKGGKYVVEEPEFESEPEPVKPAKPVKVVKTKTVQVPTTITEREIATETETEIITVERTVFQPRTATAIQTSTETVISCTATKTEALDTITTTIAATTVTETKTETLKPEFNLHACIPEPTKEAESAWEAEPAWEAAPVRESKREPIDEREYEKYDDYEGYNEPRDLRPLPFIGEQSDEVEDMWSRWAKGPAPELPESPYELENPNCAPRGSRCYVKDPHCCGGACSAFNSGGMVGVCAQEPVEEHLPDVHAPRQPNQWFEGAKKWGY